MDGALESRSVPCPVRMKGAGGSILI